MARNKNAADFPVPTCDRDADFPARDSYVDRRIREGYERKCVYPDNGIPKQKEGKRVGMPSVLGSAFKAK